MIGREFSQTQICIFKALDANLYTDANLIRISRKFVLDANYDRREFVVTRTQILSNANFNYEIRVLPLVLNLRLISYT